MNGVPLHSTPYPLFVDADEVSPKTTSLLLSESSIQAIAGRKTSFKISAKDAFGNSLGMGGARFYGCLVAQDNSESSIDIAFEDLNDGTYKGVCPHRSAGKLTFL